MIQVDLVYREKIEEMQSDRTITNIQLKEYFEDIVETPYMTMTYKVKTNTLPAITHVDGTARVQTVKRSDNELYYDLLLSIKERYFELIYIKKESVNLRIYKKHVFFSQKN